MVEVTRRLDRLEAMHEKLALLTVWTCETRSRACYVIADLGADVGRAIGSIRQVIDVLVIFAGEWRSAALHSR
jgi:hypothetical protein